MSLVATAEYNLTVNIKMDNFISYNHLFPDISRTITWVESFFQLVHNITENKQIYNFFGIQYSSVYLPNFTRGFIPSEYLSIDQLFYLQCTSVITYTLSVHLFLIPTNKQISTQFTRNKSLFLTQIMQLIASFAQKMPATYHWFTMVQYHIHNFMVLSKK